MSKNRKEKSVWERTSVQCLYRHGKSGRYYLRTKSGKKEIWRSLKTTTWSVAKLRLADQLKDIRQARGSNRAMESGEMTMTDCVRIYRDRFEGNGDLSEGTRHVRRTALNRLVKTWPGFGSLKPQQVTAGRVYEWAARLKRDGTGFSPPGSLSQSERTRGISPSSVNQAVATLKRVLNVAVESGAIYANPADAKPPEGSGRLRARESSKKIRLPGKDEFFRLFEEMESSGSGWAPYAADLSRFLAFSGVRVGEARQMTWGRVDFDGEVLHVPGTKSETSVRTVPMIDMNERPACHYPFYEPPPIPTGTRRRLRFLVFSWKGIRDAYGTKLSLASQQLPHRDLRLQGAFRGRC